MKFLLLYTTLHIISLSLYTYHTYKQNHNIFITILDQTHNPFFHILHSVALILIFYIKSRILIYIFLDNVRSEEQIIINDNLFIFLTDIMLIISIFSDEVSIKNLTLFSFLLVTKCMSWLISDRVKTQKDNNIRSLILILLFQSIFFSLINLYTFFQYKSISILFSFEYVIISLLLLKSFVLTLIDDPTHVFYVDISYTSFKLVSISTFFLVTTVHYRIPFNVFRETITTAKLLIKKMNNFAAYKIILNKLKKCKKVTEGICPICTEEIVGSADEQEKDEPEDIEKERTEKEDIKQDNITGDNITGDNISTIRRNTHDTTKNQSTNNPSDNYLNLIKNINTNVNDIPQDTDPGIELECRHTFHLKCLKRWVEQQQVCPVCRDNIIKKKDKKKYYGDEQSYSEGVNDLNVEDDSLIGIPVERE